jgi:acylphosphatase
MENKELIRLRAVVSGRVQRVGFRSYSAEGAVRLGLVGWTVNRSDGTVEIVAEGIRAALEKYILHLRQGPVGGRVDDIETEWLPAEGKFKRFRIRWTG